MKRRKRTWQSRIRECILTNLKGLTESGSFEEFVGTCFDVYAHQLRQGK